MNAVSVNQQLISRALSSSIYQVETQRYEYNKLQRAKAQKSLKDGAQDPDSVTNSKKIHSRLTDERIRKLDSIGFEWKVRNKMKRYYDKQWHSMFQRLVDFKKIHGHTLVPKRYVKAAMLHLGVFLDT